MRMRTVHISSDNADFVSFDKYLMSGNTNDKERGKMKKIMMNAIKDGLTDRQRYCLTEHYLKKRPQNEIAAELGVNNSTVSRHVNAALGKLKQIASYYF